MSVLAKLYHVSPSVPEDPAEVPSRVCREGTVMTALISLATNSSLVCTHTSSSHFTSKRHVIFMSYTSEKTLGSKKINLGRNQQNLISRDSGALSYMCI